MGHGVRGDCYSNDPSSNPVQALSFFWKMLFEKSLVNQKET